MWLTLALAAGCHDGVHDVAVSSPDAAAIDATATSTLPLFGEVNDPCISAFMLGLSDHTGVTDLTGGCRPSQ